MPQACRRQETIAFEPGYPPFYCLTVPDTYILVSIPSYTNFTYIQAFWFSYIPKSAMLSTTRVRAQPPAKNIWLQRLAVASFVFRGCWRPRYPIQPKINQTRKLRTWKLLVRRKITDGSPHSSSRSEMKIKAHTDNRCCIPSR